VNNFGFNFSNCICRQRCQWESPNPVSWIRSWSCKLGVVHKLNRYYIEQTFVGAVSLSCLPEYGSYQLFLTAKSFISWRVSIHNTGNLYLRLQTILVASCFICVQG
jgi:hypothetical protein